MNHLKINSKEIFYHWINSKSKLSNIMRLSHTNLKSFQGIQLNLKILSRHSVTVRRFWNGFVWFFSIFFIGAYNVSHTEKMMAICFDTNIKGIWEERWAPITMTLLNFRLTQIAVIRTFHFWPWNIDHDIKKAYEKERLRLT